MTTWIEKTKRLLNGFLSTQASKYITTESGLKLQILDVGKFTGRAKANTTFVDKIKS